LKATYALAAVLNISRALFFWFPNMRPRPGLNASSDSSAGGEVEEVGGFSGSEGFVTSSIGFTSEVLRGASTFLSIFSGIEGLRPLALSGDFGGTSIGAGSGGVGLSKFLLLGCKGLGTAAPGSLPNLDSFNGGLPRGGRRRSGNGVGAAGGSESDEPLG
jgi:hypothetical protein